MKRRRVKWVEYDVASRRARKVLAFLQRPGATDWWKTYIRRRERRDGKAETRRED